MLKTSAIKKQRVTYVHAFAFLTDTVRDSVTLVDWLVTLRWKKKLSLVAFHRYHLLQLLLIFSA
jgi:hypothetical protein